MGGGALPNMNDFKRGFEEEDKDDFNQEHVLYRPSQVAPADGSPEIRGRGGAPSPHRRKSSAESEEPPVGYRNMQVVKKDTNKIKTNPKYKCVDEVSGDENEAQKNEDYQNLSSKELDFRETILKFESTQFRY